MKSHEPHPSRQRRKRKLKLSHKTTTNILVWAKLCDCDKEVRYKFREAGLVHSYANYRMHNLFATTIYTQTANPELDLGIHLMTSIVISNRRLLILTIDHNDNVCEVYTYTQKHYVSFMCMPR